MEKGDLYSAASSSSYLGKYALEAGDTKAALAFFSESHRMAARVGAERLAERSASSLSRVFLLLGYVDSSLYYSRASDQSRLDLDERKAAEILSRHHVNLLSDAFKEQPPALGLGTLGIVLLGSSALGFLSYHFRHMTVTARKTPASSVNPIAAVATPDRTSSGTIRVPIPSEGRGDCHGLMADIMLDHRIKRILGCLQDCLTSVDEGRRTELKKAIREIENQWGDDLWDSLEARFNEAYDGFIAKIREKVPDLSHNERRLCLLLRMDMCTKEISRVTGQSIRAVELGRIRLRKKLNLTHTEHSLNEYLAGI